MDAFDVKSLLALRETHKFNKIFLDVNGSRDTATITTLISIYAGAKWGAGTIEMIVVKNWRLANLMRSCELSGQLLGRPEEGLLTRAEAERGFRDGGMCGDGSLGIYAAVAMAGLALGLALELALGPARRAWAR
jgi:hypothetical protein